jgi:ubiquinone/menaquinone biosynthesis C-methylase UbiE
MEPGLQRRIQRYGWDAAAADYEALWRVQLSSAQAKLLACARLEPGQRVLDIACGTGLTTLAAAAEIGPRGEIIGVDLSGEMIAFARRRAARRDASNVRFLRRDAEKLDLPGACFDIVLCSLGLMYVPQPDQALREMRRVLRPGGRLALAVWGERSRCGWSPVFPIVAAEVTSEVCPLFFNLGIGDSLARLCAAVGFSAIEQHRIAATLSYATADEACDAALVGGPVALAWSRFDDAARTRVRSQYAEAISPWQYDGGYRVPGEFVVVAAVAAAGSGN